MKDIETMSKKELIEAYSKLLVRAIELSFDDEDWRLANNKASEALRNTLSSESQQRSAQ